MKDWINKIHCGDALAVLKEMPDSFIDMVMTSPPYWGLRDYGVENQLGLESTFQEYIIKLCDIFDEVKRVLKDTGTIWVNLGDSYLGSGQGGGDIGISKERYREELLYYKKSDKKRPSQNYGGMSKSLAQVPFRFSIEMANRGWILRNTIIWFKKNCMPSSAKDRFTVDFEYLFFFSKSNETQYWTNEKTFELVKKQPLGTKGIEGKDWEWRIIGENYSECDTKISPDNAQKLSSLRARVYRGKKQKKVALWTGHDYYFEQQFEKLKESSIERANYGWHGKEIEGIGRNSPSATDKMGNRYAPEQGRNKRCIWEIATESFPEAHFAVYPEELCITPIKAGCPEFICKKCGKPKEPIWEKNIPPRSEGTIKQNQYVKNNNRSKGADTFNIDWSKIKKNMPADKIIGYAKCGCNVGFNLGIVLDPFSGVGTTCLVARKLGRQYIGIEIKLEYKNMGDKRIHNEAGLL